jgi:hypothetical protein
MAISLVFNSRDPYRNLLDSAMAAHEQNQYKEAVILAQTSLELFTEKILGHLYVVRDIVYLKAEFEHLLINYNLVNAKVSGLYIALSGDQIKQEPFWSALADHTELRNALVHEGEDATHDQSRNSLDAVARLIEHVTKFNDVK